MSRGSRRLPGVLARNLSVCVMTESVPDGFLSRVPILSVYEFRFFFSLYFQRIKVRGKAQSGLQKQSFTALGKHIMLAIHKISRIFPREQRENREGQKDREKERETETGKEIACLVCFGFQRQSGSEFSLAGLHTVSGNNPLLGKTPSTFLDTSSRRKIPVLCVLFHLCL